MKTPTGRTGPKERHGHASRGKLSPTYMSWDAMWKRTRQPNRDNHKVYFDRGIKVCSRWKKFSYFLADMGERPAGKTLDRIDGNGNYEPSNCRWATPTEQIRNSAATRLTFENAVTIIMRRLSGATLREAGKDFNADQSLVWKITNRKRWMDATPEARRRLQCL